MKQVLFFTILLFVTAVLIGYARQREVLRSKTSGQTEFETTKDARCEKYKILKRANETGGKYVEFEVLYRKECCKDSSLCTPPYHSHIGQTEEVKVNLNSIIRVILVGYLREGKSETERGDFCSNQLSKANSFSRV